MQDIGEIKKDKFFKDLDWNKLGKFQIVPPLNLVKNKLENNNNIFFKRKKKKEQNDYFLDFHIIKKVEQFTFIRKYVHNKTNEKIYLNKENNLKEDNKKEEEGKKDNNEKIIININENYIEGAEQNKNQGSEIIKSSNLKK